MRITVDTNILLRAAVKDDPAQSGAVIDALEGAEMVAVSLQALCEFAWVLNRRYRVSRTDIALAIRSLLEMRNVVVDRPAVEWGLALHEAGGDFADGVIAFEGAALGADTFISFDRKAVSLLGAQGRRAKLLT
jgi:predicted nucleic-acid-binding protein